MAQMDQELHTELQQIQAKLDRLLYLKPVVEKHDVVLYGDRDVAGIVTRLDRLEQKAAQHKWIVTIALTAFLSSTIEWVKKLFS